MPDSLAAARDVLRGVTAHRGGRAVALTIAALVGWAVTAALLPKGLPLGIVLLGVVLGTLSSLTALGLVLIYRSARIVNFAQAEIGAAAAVLAVLLSDRKGVNYFVAVGIGLAAALISGALFEIVLRRFFNAPRLILTVATIGVAQILAAAVLYLPDFISAPGKEISRTVFAINFDTPFHFRRAIFPVVFTGDHVIAFLAVLVVLAGLMWFFNRTDSGIGARGAADSRERAMLLGIPVRRLSLITWVVAAGLSGMGAILTAGVQGFAVNTIAGPTGLLAPLAAAALARFESLTTAFFSSIALAVFAQGVYWNYPRSTTVNVALFGVILVALLFQRRRAGVQGEELGGFVAVQEVPVIPKILRRLPEVRVARVLSAFAAAFLAGVVPLLVSNSLVINLQFAAIYGIIAVSLVVLTGWAGQMSLGQFAFVGLGAATAGSLLVHAHADFLLALVAATGVGAVAAIIIGLPALRLPGLFLAPVTLALAVAVSTFFLNSLYFPTFTPFRVPQPLILDRFDLSAPRTLYYLCLGGLVVAIVLARNFRRGRLGRAVLAVRDNERMAAGFSIDPVRLKVTAFAVSGALAGFAGALYVLAAHGLPFEGFNPLLSLQVFTMVVVGGLGSIFGGVLGAVNIQLAQVFLSGATLLVTTGVGLLLVLLMAPGGLAEQVFATRDALLRWVARRRNLSVPGFTERPHDEGGVAAAAAVPQPSVGQGAPARPEALLACQGIDAGYGHLQVLFGVDLDIAEGGIVGLVGTNGAGKTTTLKVIAGLIQPMGGRVLFAGEDITDLSPIERVRRGIVAVPAKAIFGSLSVRENLRLAAWQARRVGDRQFVDGAMARVFELFPVLRERLDQKASLLSGGEQQMLTLAQALLCRPRLLMIDELTLGLAPILVSSILDVVRDLNASGITILVVEQSLNIASTIANRAFVMEKGRMRFAGPTVELTASPDLARSVFLRAPAGIRSGDGSRAVPARTARAAYSGDGARVALAARGVSKAYGGVTALADLNLDIRRGQTLGIIGTNGAGKTTAFDVFSGFTGPDGGTVAFNGVDITNAPAAARASLGLGRTFQDVRLVPSLTTAEMLAVSLERHVEVREPFACILNVGATVRSESRVRAQVGELIEMFGLGDYRDVFVSELPTGIRRVLELACAAGHRPNLLLLDEPSSGLSEREAEAMAEMLLDLKDQMGTTLAIIEHDVQLVSGLSDELVCMHLGQVLARGTPKAVLSDPAVIASYLGTDEVAALPSGSRRAAGAIDLSTPARRVRRSSSDVH